MLSSNSLKGSLERNSFTALHIKKLNNLIFLMYTSFVVTKKETNFEKSSSLTIETQEMKTKQVSHSLIKKQNKTKKYLNEFFFFIS